MIEIVSYPIDVLASYHYFRADAERMARLHDQGSMHGPVVFSLCPLQV
jgi:acyl-coenzyme A thioesterase PaaI-like protein